MLPLVRRFSFAVALSVALLVIAVFVSGCVEQEAPTPPPAAEPEPSQWRVANGSPVVGTPTFEEDPEMAAAVAEAQRTAEAAHERWSAASPQQRERWLVKWAAPTLENEIEHVWVQPINWSPFRIEGVLLSEPIQSLLSGSEHGDVVSFPIEELSDWVYFPATNAQRDIHGEIEGGFTIKVLEQRYGRP